MSSLGQKITRRAQVLGQKIESKGQQLGQKAGQYLRMADAGLRKTENTLKNVCSYTSIRFSWVFIR